MDLIRFRVQLGRRRSPAAAAESHEINYTWNWTFWPLRRRSSLETDAPLAMSSTKKREEEWPEGAAE